MRGREEWDEIEGASGTWKMRERWKERARDGVGEEMGVNVTWEI